MQGKCSLLLINELRKYLFLICVVGGKKKNFQISEIESC